MLPPTHTTETLPAGTKVWVDENHRFGTDSLLLSQFCEFKQSWSACDFGTGCGILLLALKDRGLQGTATGIDINPNAAALLHGAAMENNFTDISALEMDLRDYRPKYKIDLLVSNPPYFTAGPASPNPARATARHQGSCTLDDLCAAAPRVLKEKGLFCLCFPANGLTSLFSTLQKHRLQAKRLRLVRKSPEDSPWLALVESRLGGGEGLSILPDLIIPPGTSVQY